MQPYLFVQKFLQIHTNNGKISTVLGVCAIKYSRVIRIREEVR